MDCIGWILTGLLCIAGDDADGKTDAVVDAVVY